MRKIIYQLLLIFDIYGDVESSIKKIDGCANNPEKSSTGKLGEHILGRYLMSTIWAFDNIENFISWGRLYEKSLYFFKKTCYKCNFWKEENVIINKKRAKYTQRCNKMLHFCKTFLKKFPNDENYRKVRDHCNFTGIYRGAAHRICNLGFNKPNEIPLIFNNGSNYDYHSFIKELANEFEGQYECLEKNTEKYKLFPFNKNKSYKCW